MNDDPSFHPSPNPSPRPSSSKIALFIEKSHYLSLWLLYFTKALDLLESFINKSARQLVGLIKDSNKSETLVNLKLV
jgi:hypothetical protein